jgi:hypothetical protein
MEELFKNLSHLMNYRKQIPAEGFTELINKILSGLPGIGWELGPDPIEPELDRLSLSVKHAPELLDNAAFAAGFPLHGDGWIADLGVPPREWEMFFRAKLNGKTYEIEGREWFWQMLEEGEAVRLVFAAPSATFGDLGKAELNEFAEIIATGELGELNVLRLLASVETVLIDAPGEPWQAMDRLRKQFVKRFPSCAYSAWFMASPN